MDAAVRRGRVYGAVKLPGRSTGSGDEEAGAGAGYRDDGVRRPYLGLASQALGTEVAGDDLAVAEGDPLAHVGGEVLLRFQLGLSSAEAVLILDRHQFLISGDVAMFLQSP
jgi:hypothetical protein